MQEVPAAQRYIKFKQGIFLDECCCPVTAFQSDDDKRIRRGAQFYDGKPEDEEIPACHDGCYCAWRRASRCRGSSGTNILSGASSDRRPDL